MIGLILLGTLLLMLLGAPVYVFLGLPAAFGMLVLGIPGEAIAARVYESMRSDTLITVPMFVLVGHLLVSSRAMSDLVRFFDSLVGHIRGGMVLVVVAVAIFFAGISGATTAEASIMALALAGPMEVAGYPRRFTAGLIASAATVGILIPPSVPMILYAAITGENLGDLFIAGLLPGLFIAALLGATGLLIARRRGYGGSRPSSSRTERRTALVRALPIMTIPVFIIVALYSGFSTAAEVGAMAAVASVAVTALVYRDLSRAKLFKVLRDTARVSAAVLIMTGTAQLLSFVLTYERTPQELAGLITAAGLGAVGFLIAINVFMLILGIPLDPPPIMFMTLPIVYPILAPLGIDPVHFAVVMMVNMTIAQVSPPMGSALYAMAVVAKIPLPDVFRGVLPFIAVLLLGLIVVTYVPALSLVLV